MGPVEISIIVGVVAAVGAIAVAAVMIQRRIERRRTDCMRAWSDAMGLSFAEEVRDLSGRHPQFELFQQGHSHRPRNIISGDVEISDIKASLLCGDFQFTLGSGKSQQTIKSTFIMVVPRLTMHCSLRIRSTNWFDRVKALVGVPDLEVGHRQFSSKFHVECDDASFAQALLDGAVAEHFLAPGPGLAAAPTFEWRRGGLLIWSPKRWEIGQIVAALEWLEGFFSRMPDDLRGGRTVAAPADGAEDELA